MTSDMSAARKIAAETASEAPVTSLPTPPAVGSALDLIGKTPMVELTEFDTGPCRLFVKLESAESRRLDQGPHRPLDDRGGRGATAGCKPGGTLVEATAGNTGLGLAQVGPAEGLQLMLVVPDKMAREKIQHLRALGADVRITRSDVGKGHPEYYQDMAAALAARDPGAFYINQFDNPANPLAHETTTGPEICEQMGGDVDAVVVGVGSGGTLTGLGRFFAKASPKTEMVLADPVGSVLAPLVDDAASRSSRARWVVEGIGEDFMPANCDLSLVKQAYAISDRESIATARGAARPRKASSAARRPARCWPRRCATAASRPTPKRVVTFVCDTGNALPVQGLQRLLDGRAGPGRARAARRPARPDRPHARRRRRHRRARRHPAHRLQPHARRRRHPAAGARRRPADRHDRRERPAGGGRGPPHPTARFSQPVATAMTAKLHTLQAGQPLDALLPIFERDEVAIVLEGDEFLGLITRIDLINYLRRAA